MIQALQKTVIKRFESIEELVRTDKQGEEVLAKDLALLVPLRVRDDLSRVRASNSIVNSDKPANTQYPNGYKECKWKPIGIKDLKEIKHTIVYYSMHAFTIC